ncbi:MAG: hypothetical protein ACK5XP_11285 [Sphingobacteriia bacterium]
MLAFRGNEKDEDKKPSKVAKEMAQLTCDWYRYQKSGDTEKSDAALAKLYDLNDKTEKQFKNLKADEELGKELQAAFIGYLKSDCDVEGIMDIIKTTSDDESVK